MLLPLIYRKGLTWELLVEGRNLLPILTPFYSGCGYLSCSNAEDAGSILLSFCVGKCGLYMPWLRASVSLQQHRVE